MGDKERRYEMNVAKKGEWNKAKGPSAKTEAKKQLRAGSPTLIHDTARKGTFRGNLKETYKFGPAFSNADRKIKVSNKVPVEKFNKIVEKKTQAAVKKARFWGGIRNWWINLFKRGGRK